MAVSVGRCGTSSRAAGWWRSPTCRTPRRTSSSRLGRQQESAAFVYLREKKVFEPTTLHWLREPGQLAAINAERAVLREVNDLNISVRQLRGVQHLAGAGGHPDLQLPDVQATVNYKFPASHIITPAAPWVAGTAGDWVHHGPASRTAPCGNALGYPGTRLEQATGGAITYTTPVSASSRTSGPGSG